MSELAGKIRAAKPAAPAALRERVREVAARAPEPAPRRFAFPLRRVTLVGVPVAAALAVGTAGVIGLVRSGERPQPQAAPWGAAEATVGALQPERPPAFGVPVNPARPQRFEGSLTVRVEDTEALSDATKRAMRLAESLGGYVAAVDLGTANEERGTATITVRVPIERVQTALLRLSSLGTILAQRVSLQDLQQQLDELNRRIAFLRGDIADLERKLAGRGLTPRERAQLEARLEQRREELERLTGAKAQTRDEARLATLVVTLTTEERIGEPEPAGRVERTLDEAVDILAWEAAAGVYGLVAAGPALLVAAAAWLALRTRRRHEEKRLLDAN